MGAEEKQSYAEQNKARLKEITDSIETRIKELFESDKYKQYLSTMSRFHKYSVNNTMPIQHQRPDATHVASFNKWRDQFRNKCHEGNTSASLRRRPSKKDRAGKARPRAPKLPMKDENGTSS